ncbi:MAG TPA: YdeI/OmpD-associated family protein [Chloroflexota bacterium]|nr:YdeI/OmpD-associated family protein [Chloroflexota bacterium]
MNNAAARRPLTFKATLRGDSGEFIEVPAEIVRALGPGRRPAVRVVINGVELRTTLAAYGGGSQIGLRREIREAAQASPGELIEVSVELDTQPRTVEVPADLAAVLAADFEASRIFDGLSYTNRKEYVGWVLGAKLPATRERRVAEAPAMLKAGRRTPLAKP